MANTSIGYTEGVGVVLRTDRISSVDYPALKLALGAEGTDQGYLAGVDADTGAGTVYRLPVMIQFPASGGPGTVTGDDTYGLDVDVTRVSGTVSTHVTAGTITVGSLPAVSGTVFVKDLPATSGGYTNYHKAGTASGVNATSVKASAGQLYGMQLSNGGTVTAYVHFYNKASAPTVGTDTPVRTAVVPAGGGNNKDFRAGLPFSTGIAFGISTGASDTDSGTSGLPIIVVNLEYA